MTDKQDPITHAARLLREAAEELRQAHTLSSDRNNWIGEPEAKAAYDEHMTAAQALEDWEAAVGAGGVSGSLVGRAAPKAAPGEPSDAEIDEFIDLHCWDANGRRSIVRHAIARWGAAPTTRPAPQQEAQEPVAWESTILGYIKYITQAQYEKFRPNVRRWYKPYKCSNCSAPQPAPAPLSEREAFEAWFRSEYHSRLDRNMPDKSYNDPIAHTMWAAWKACVALAAQGGKDA